MRRHLASILATMIFGIAGILQAQTLCLNSDDISLEDLLNIKISTASKYDQTINQAPASVTIVTSEDIERYGYRTLDDILARVRGFYLSYDRNYSYVGVRGFGRSTDFNNRILLLLDGHTINEDVFGSAPIGTEFPLNLAMVERVEIVRGPGSALYGTGAMFAVVNIISKKGKDINGGKLKGEIGSYGRTLGALSVGKEFGIHSDATLSAVGADIKGHDLYFKEFDTPLENNGIAKGLDGDRYHGFTTALSYKYFTIEALRSSREKGIPTAAWEVYFDTKPAKTIDEWNFIELKFEKQIEDDKGIFFRSYMDYYRYEGWYQYDHLERDEAVGKWFGSELRLNWDLRSNNRLTVGAEYQNHFDAYYSYWTPPASIGKNNSPFYALSAYLQDEYQLKENLAITVGVRRDRYNTPASTTSPRGALIYNPFESSTVKALYGEAFRKPNVYESNYDDPYAGYKKNPYLKPEKIQTAEIDWEQRFGAKVMGSISIYDYLMRNLIDQVIDPVDSLIQYNNISKVKARGIELEVEAQLSAMISGFASYAYQKAEDASANIRLTNSPAHIAKAGASFRPCRHISCASDILYESDRTTVKGGRTKSYILANASIFLRPEWNKSEGFAGSLNNFELNLIVKNIFDKRYELPAGFEHRQNGIPQNGRNYIFSLEYNF